MDKKELLEKLDERLALGEISEETYKKLPAMYETAKGEKKSQPASANIEEDEVTTPPEEDEIDEEPDEEVNQWVRDLDLNDGEKVLNVMDNSGLTDVFGGVQIAITNTRIIKRIPKTLGLRADIFECSYEDVARINLKKGFLNSDIELKMRHGLDDFVLYSINNKKAKTMHSLIRGCIEDRR